MEDLNSLIKLYIERFRQRLPQIDEETGGQKQRRLLIQQVSKNFSEGAIEHLDEQTLKDIFKEFYALYGVCHPNAPREEYLNPVISEFGFEPFRNKIKELLYGSDPFEQRYVDFIESTPYIGSGITTELLCYWQPEEYAILNGKATKALKILGLDGRITAPKSGKNSGHYYTQFTAVAKEILNILKKEPGFEDAALSTVDYLLYEVSQIKYWQVAPGEGAKFWLDEPLWQNHSIISVQYREMAEGMGDELLPINSEEELLAKYCEYYPTASSRSAKAQTKMLFDFLKNMQIGDFVLANKGRTSILGYGRVASGPKRDLGMDYPIYRDVEWIDTNLMFPIPDGMKGKFGTTIKKIEDDEFKSLIGAAQNIGYWVVLPSPWNGKTGSSLRYWDFWKEQSVVSVGWAEMAAKYGDLILELHDITDFKEKFKECYQDNSQSYMLWYFLDEMKEGDIVLVNSGKEKIVGYGVIKSAPKLNLEWDFPFYREVEWVEPSLAVPILEDLKGKFSKRVIKLEKAEFDLIFSAKHTEKDTNPLFRTLETLLKNKGQVILYGPPGTGKTWTVKEYVQLLNPKKLSKKEISEDVRFFWLTVNPDLWDPNKLWTEETELWPGKYRSSFEEIQQSDIVFVYTGGKYRRLYAVARCIRKEPGTDEYPKVFIKGITTVKGPDWKTIKSDDLLAGAAPVKINLRGTLFPLEPDEGFQLLTLAQIDPEEVQITLTEEDETIKPYEFVTFHQSFSYEEFIEGLRPMSDDEGAIHYFVQEGIFKQLCRGAFNALMAEAKIPKVWSEKGKMPTLSDKEKEQALGHIDAVPFYLVIDEINRGDVSRIFGELITLLEADKRLSARNEMTATLPYSKTTFGIPPNLYIIGTMNTADRGITQIDIALRRRFGFIEVTPDYDLLRHHLSSEDENLQNVYSLSIELLQHLNEIVLELLDRDHQIGHSYLMRLKDAETAEEGIASLTFIWYHEILPLLQEYFYDTPAKLKTILGPDFVEVANRSFRFKDRLCDDEFLQACSRLVGATNLNTLGEMP